MRDIYDPPPAPRVLGPNDPGPLPYSGRDLLWLVVPVALCGVASYEAGRYEPTLWPAVLLGGLFVTLESWFSSLTFVHRHPRARALGFWRIFLAAFAPWALGLGAAAALLLGLFALTDWLRF